MLKTTFLGKDTGISTESLWKYDPNEYIIDKRLATLVYEVSDVERLTRVPNLHPNCRK